jgi:hypothetical protein
LLLPTPPAAVLTLALTEGDFGCTKVEACKKD